MWHSAPMFARLRRFWILVANTFWVLPGAVIAAAGLLAVACVQLDRTGRMPRLLLDSVWLYNGGATGARTLLGAVAASAIGVAGTVFSITIAALTLAAAQMGPRLLRNFVRDRGNQLTLGILLGTFTYALMVLRSVRATEEGGFTPHLALTVAIALALLCVAMLIYFVGHVAGRINVDTVIGLVGADLQRSLRSTALADRQDAQAEGAGDWAGATSVMASKSGYLQQLDAASLVAWAGKCRTRIKLLVRPGDYVFPGAVVAMVKPAVDDAPQIIESAMALGSERTGDEDLEYAIRQLVEVAIRALSPGINDPFTAVSVIHRLGTALCELVNMHLPSGQHVRDGQLLVEVPAVDYDGLADAMFHSLRQCAAGNAMVLMQMLEVLTAVAGCEPEAARRTTLRRHADLLLADGERTIANAADLADLRARHRKFLATPAPR